MKLTIHHSVSSSDRFSLVASMLWEGGREGRRDRKGGREGRREGERNRGRRKEGEKGSRGEKNSAEYGT